MTELFQIPTEFNEANPEDFLFIQRGISPYQAGKIRAANLNLGGDSQGIYIGDIPPDSPYLGMPWIEPSSGQLWIYSYIDDQYRWKGQANTALIANNQILNNLVFSLDFDYLIESFSCYLYTTTLTISSNPSADFIFRTFDIGSGVPSLRIIQTVRITGIQSNSNFSKSEICNKIFIPKYNNNFNDVSDLIGVRLSYQANNYSGGVTPIACARYSLVRKE